MSVCWKPGWCECPDCGPLVAIADLSVANAGTSNEEERRG